MPVPCACLHSAPSKKMQYIYLTADLWQLSRMHPTQAFSNECQQPRMTAHALMQVSRRQYGLHQYGRPDEMCRWAPWAGVRAVCHWLGAHVRPDVHGVPGGNGVRTDEVLADSRASVCGHEIHNIWGCGRLSCCQDSELLGT